MTITKLQIPQIISYLDNRKIPYDKEFLTKLSLYHDLILLWSNRMNLVSGGDMKNLISNHFLDSLDPIAEIPDTGEMIDIGSGAGFPAIPFAIFRPRLKVTLLESIHKKILFLKTVKEYLGLENTEVIEMRLEQFSAPRKFDLATIRALPGREKHIGKIKELIKSEGKIIIYEKRGLFRVVSVYHPKTK
jgi:16S rRNA (guanine527-N7)-methyltransferase